MHVLALTGWSRAQYIRDQSNLGNGPDLQWCQLHALFALHETQACIAASAWLDGWMD